MAKVQTGYIIIIVILAILIGVFVWLTIDYQKKFRGCVDNESIFCFSLACPGNVNPDDPCAGYASRIGPHGETMCSTLGSKMLKIPTM